MQSQQKIQESGLSPSFSCYFSNSLTSKVVTKVILEEHFDKYELEFSFILNDDHDEDISVLINSPLRKLFTDEQHVESESSSSSMTKCKKSSSTGSGSKRWSISYFLKRSNSEGKEHPMVLLTHKKVDSPKLKRNSGEVSKSGSRLKAQTPVHERV
ncbi:hypothetical protein Tco_0431139 [Tanacetum coccineum]